MQCEGSGPTPGSRPLKRSAAPCSEAVQWRGGWRWEALVAVVAVRMGTVVGQRAAAHGSLAPRAAHFSPW